MPASSPTSLPESKASQRDLAYGRFFLVPLDPLDAGNKSKLSAISFGLDVPESVNSWTDKAAKTASDRSTFMPPRR